MTMRSRMMRTAAARLSLACVAAAGFLACEPLPCAAADKPAAEKELLELTGGKRLKVVWIQDNVDGPNRGDANIKYYDSKAGVIEDLPILLGYPPPPAFQGFLSLDGRRVFMPTAKAKVVVYDLETKKSKEILRKKGDPAGNSLLAVWMDPKSGKEWVYVNDRGEKGEAWNAPAGKVYRFPVDKPEDCELFWDRTSSHGYLMFSADGTKACFQPSWGNIGQLSIAYGRDGKIDQDKSDFKTYGAGCYPSMAPDNSYRVFRLEGDHRAITMHDAGGGNARNILTAVMPGVKEVNGKSWLTRWSTHPRFMTCMAPDGPRARIWLLRFDEGFTRIEGAVPVTNEGDPKCWNSHAWIDDSGAAKKAEKPGKPAVKAEKPGKPAKKAEKPAKKPVDSGDR